MTFPRPRGPLIVLGALTLLCAYLAIVYELALVMMLLGFLLSLFVIGLAVALIGSPALVMRREHPAEVMAGETFSVTLGVINASVARSALFVEVVDELMKVGEPRLAVIASLSPAEQADVVYRSKILKRGETKISRVECASRFPFGLFERRWIVTSTSMIIVLPRPGLLRRDILLEAPVEQAEVPVAVRGGMGEFHGVREYHHDDNPKRIHWRTSARRGQLHVREFEREIERRLVVVLGACEDLEAGVALAATLLDHYARRGYRVALAVIGSRPAWVPFGMGPDHVRRALRALALAGPGTGEPGGWSPGVIRGAYVVAVGQAPMEKLSGAASVQSLTPSADLVAEADDGTG